MKQQVHLLAFSKVIQWKYTLLRRLGFHPARAPEGSPRTHAAKLARRSELTRDAAGMIGPAATEDNTRSVCPPLHRRLCANRRSKR